MCAAATAVAAAIAAAKCRVENGKWNSKFSIHTAVFVFFAAIAVQYAGAKHGGTNSPPRSGSVECRVESVELRSLSSSIQNEQLHNSTLSTLHSQFPTNAVLHDKWWKRGAWADMLRVEFPQGWVFPFGEEHLSFVDVVSQGSLRRRWTDTNEVASVGIPLALVPFSSVSWHELTPSNSCRFAWSGALAGRSPDAPVDAAIELFRNGAVSIETNGVSRRIERPWPYGETNAVMDVVAANSMVGGNGLFVLSVAFTSAPPETVCLCVGTNRVAVSDAQECCFVLEKGVRHGISMSYVPEGLSFQWWDEPQSMRSPPMRSGFITERMEAFGSSGEIDFEDPSYDGTGSILWDCSLYIAPDSENDPAYPLLLYAYMDVPLGEWPTVSWRSGDGAISATGEWLTLDERPDSDMISVTATWRGRTWRGCVCFWTDVERSIVALDGGGTIFVESAYTNRPDEVTLRTSTEQRLSANWALKEEGTLTLSAANGAAISVRLDSPDGPELELPYSWYGYEGDVGFADLCVVNNDPSRAGESVWLSLEFDGNGGDYCSDSSGLLEVVRYCVRADALWPSNRVRHVFGPLETFKAILDNGTKFPFTAPLTLGVANMSFDYNGSTCTFPIRVVPPNGVAGLWRANDLECSCGTIGAGFYADVQVLPTYVSFAYGLRIMEGEADMAGPWGCFKNYSSQYPPEQFAHNEAHGALKPLSILAENKVKGYDHVRTDLSDFPIEDGGYHLNIPLKWGIDGGPYTHDAGHVVQTISVQTNGTVSVSKFEITARRKPNEDYQ